MVTFQCQDLNVGEARLPNQIATDISAMDAAIGSGAVLFLRPGVGQKAHIIRPNGLGEIGILAR